MEASPHDHEQTTSSSSGADVVVFGSAWVADTEKIKAAIDAGSTVVITGRRASATGPLTKIVFRGLAIDLGARRATYSSRDLRLTEQELRILTALARDPGRALSYDDLSFAAWNTKSPRHADPIRSAIKRLRRKLEFAGADVAIEAARGFGFRLADRTGADERRGVSS